MVNFETNLQARISKSQDGLTEALQLDMQLMQMFFFYQVDGEGLPISLLESMYMKKACVVSNVIGNRDVIHNGENGFVCTKVEDFVKAIEECQGEVEKLTEHAYQDILKMYNTKVMAEQYRKKYEMAINKLGVQPDVRLYVLTNDDYATAKAVA